MAGERFIDQYASALDVLTFNSKPIINQLTTMADENKAHATEIVEKIESRIKEVVSHSSAWTFVSFMLWENICVYLCLKMIVSTICVEIVIVTSKESIIKKKQNKKEYPPAGYLCSCSSRCLQSRSFHHYTCWTPF